VNRRRKPTKPPAFVPLRGDRRPPGGGVDAIVPRTVAQTEERIERVYERGVGTEIDAVLDPLAVQVGWLTETEADRMERYRVALEEWRRWKRRGDDGLAPA
jgi:hypothetical protein